MNNTKLIITKHKQHIITSLFEEYDLLQVNIEEEDTHSLLGNIYLGKVKNIVKNINAAFVEIADKQVCYLSLENLTKPFFKEGMSNDTKVSQLMSNDTIHQGDEIFVQVSKEDVKTKAPVVTTSLSFTGKYLVLMHGKSMVGVSSKINNSDKNRLRKLLTPYITDDFGFIIRTNSAEADEENIINEAESLIKIYEKVKRYGVCRNCFSLLYETLPAYICAIRDGFAEDLSEIITDEETIYEQIKNYLSEYQQEDINKLRFYKDDFSLNRLYNIINKITEACKEKVWLKSGASLIIQPTEALFVIDVNTGKAVYGKKDVQKTFYNVNTEAAFEIARQIRLRNLSGIIIIDFINMESQEDKNKLIDLLKEYVKEDPVKTTVIDMTALNLVEITRKKVRKPLYEQCDFLIQDLFHKGVDKVQYS